MKRQGQGDRLIQDMERRGILVRAASRSGVAEEAGLAYKDLAAVVDTLHRLDFSRPVVSLTDRQHQGLCEAGAPQPGSGRPGLRVVVACNPAFFFAGFVAPALHLPLVINHKQRRKP